MLYEVFHSFNIIFHLFAVSNVVVNSLVGCDGCSIFGKCASPQRACVLVTGVGHRGSLLSRACMVSKSYSSVINMST